MVILIVEDNLAHLKITEYVLKRSRIDAEFVVVRDGQEALDYLLRKNRYADETTAPAPDLILLDLNLPKRDGREVLRIIKADPSLKDLPVVIVSTSDREEDVTFAFQHGAVAYISKAGGFDRFSEELSTVTEYAKVKS